MRPIGKRLTFALLTTLGLVAVCLAATGRIEDKDCPVCSSTLSVTLLYSSNNAGGADPDFMERCGGGYPLIVEPIFCEECRFACWSAEMLEKPVPERLKQALLSENPPFQVPEYQPILPNGPLRLSFTEGLDSEQATPAWVRYDLIEQQLVYLDETAWLKFQAAQKAVWAVRLRENPLQEFLYDLSREDIAAVVEGVDIPTGGDNPAGDQIALARALVEKGVSTRPQAIVAAFLLRSHGELGDLESALPALMEVIDEPDLEKSVNDSIELERRYLVRALGHTEELIENLPEKVDLGTLRYVRGELFRRLGRPGEAFLEYKMAREQGVPDWLEDWLESQTKMCEPVEVR